YNLSLPRDFGEAVLLGNLHSGKENEVKIKDSGKGKPCLVASIRIKGEKSEKILEMLIPSLIKEMRFPKSMWWSEKTLTFARPIRYILALFDNRCLKVKLGVPDGTTSPKTRGRGGIPCGNKTRGHSFFHHKPIVIKSADIGKYQEALKKAKVIVDPAERKSIMNEQIKEIAEKYNVLCNEPDLVDEVTNLVEYPIAIECQFDEPFLSLPAPVIESAMKSHQRYFPLRDSNNKLIPRFIVISNNPDLSKSALIKEGNERVIKARLSDASFFWKEDRKIPFSEYARRLDSIAFLGKLGTMADKAKRLEQLALFIAEGWCSDRFAEFILTPILSGEGLTA
ncbi:MAG: glycine--tRNA ligase subunit beta, partial [Planctomycetota bacterium]|nr:glycine--tRNA ligase subunit beta [Planctomycetota bacterium]